jgi:hypothetical protein
VIGRQEAGGLIARDGEGNNGKYNDGRCGGHNADEGHHGRDTVKDKHDNNTDLNKHDNNRAITTRRTVTRTMVTRITIENNRAGHFFWDFAAMLH